MVKHIEVLYRCGIGDIAARTCRHLVEYRQGVAHGSVGFLRYDVERGSLGLYSLRRSHALHVRHHVGYGYTVEVIYLAPRQDSGDNFVLLRGGKNENHISRRLFKSLKESIESLRGEHMHLVDDEHTVTAHRRRHHHLLYQAFHIVDTVMGGGVKLYDVQRAIFIELPTGIALVASLAGGRPVGAVDCFGENTGTRCLAHAPRSAE